MDLKCVVCAKAIQVMTEKLFEAERLNKSSDEKVNDVIWPILKSAHKKMLEASRGEKVDLEKWS
jgi:hypothetical protein